MYFQPLFSRRNGPKSVPLPCRFGNRSWNQSLTDFAVSPYWTFSRASGFTTLNHKTLFEPHGKEATTMQPSCNNAATKLQPSCNQAATKMQPRCNQAATKLQPSCNQAATKMQPSCNQAATKLQPKLDKYTIWPFFDDKTHILAPYWVHCTFTPWLQPSCNQAATKLQLSCNQAATKLQPSCN